MSTPNATFDAYLEINHIRTRRAEARRLRYRKSRLDKHYAELMALRQAGASLAELADWLRWKHRCHIHRSSIARYLKRWERLATELTTTEEPVAR